MPSLKSYKCSTLRVFEAFSGIGAQNAALRNLGIDYEIVGTSDWFVNAIIAYDAIHTCGTCSIELPSYDEQVKFLNKYHFSYDSQKPLKRVELLDTETINRLYVAHRRTRNFGAITDIDPTNLPDIDLLIYSFPCQDLSTGGNGNGMAENSGTRSSAIWSLRNILRVLYKNDSLPQYLLMENVPAIGSARYAKDFGKWKRCLNRLGYWNDPPVVLDASQFGIPQDRRRLFMISHLGSRLGASERIHTREWQGNVAEFLKFDYSNEILKKEADEASLNLTPSRKTMWRINKREPPFTDLIHTITCNMDRTQTAALFKYGDRIRRLTIREAFLLMGFSERDYEKVNALGFSYRQKNKLIGNAIVVPVLEEIFRAMLEGSVFMPSCKQKERDRA